MTGLRPHGVGLPFDLRTTVLDAWFLSDSDVRLVVTLAETTGVQWP